MSAEKILVAVSGGVDSAVAALLLHRQGFDIECAYMKTWKNEDSAEALRNCPWQQEIKDARAVCEKIGVPFSIVNLIDAYRQRVVDYMVEGYAEGVTPNPDVLCNREMKFGIFLDYARKRGFSAVATGHYARRRENADGTATLMEGVDKNKDQSYFLALMRPEQAQAARFPVGHLTKPQLRDIALEADLPVARKKDSQGICFLGKIKIQEFLAHHIPENPGDIVTAEGRVVGHHKGLHNFTLGQRHGLNVPSNTDHKAYVVVAKDAARNRLVVAFDGPEAPGLWGDTFRVHSLSWITAPLAQERTLLVRPRYRDPKVSARFIPVGENEAVIECETPQRAIATGQICAFYDGEDLLGGGVFGDLAS